MNLESFRDLLRDLLNSAHRFEIDSLRGQHQCGITRMDPGVFYMLRDGPDYEVAMIGHRIYFHFLGIFHELADHDRIFRRDLNGLREESL